MILSGAATMLVGTVRESTLPVGMEMIQNLFMIVLQAILTSSTTIAQLYVGRIVTVCTLTHAFCI
jgi:hypothetical protein